MRRIGIVLVVALLMAGCGGDSDSDSDPTGSGGTDDPVTSSSDAPDPCTLAGDSVLVAYFGDAEVEGEPTEAGPIMGCRWRNASSDSLLIQVASDFDLFRPDPCDGCGSLSFGDDGFAAESSLQSSATVVDGSLWLSVTTTGFGDDLSSITDLLETVFENATG
ncbi:MAG: hypothetical protein ACR2OI_04495 [Acidimicrobiia bacterium]